MRIVFALGFLFAYVQLFGQRSLQIRAICRELQLEERTIYIFCRGTVSKSGSIARKFNLKDSSSTHVGLGFFEQGQVRIYNVVDRMLPGNALVVDSMPSFLASPDLYYLGVWTCAASALEFARFRQLLEEMRGRRVIFDVSFNIRGDDTLYCSEFCSRILRQTAPKRFRFEPVTRELQNVLYRSVLGRKLLRYYPVDFFQSGPGIRKIFEFRFDNR